MENGIKKYLMYILLPIIICSLLFSSCGSKKSGAMPDYASSKAVKDSAANQNINTSLNNKNKEVDKKESPKDDKAVSKDNSSGRKIIQRGNIQLQTLDFDKTINGIIAKTNSAGGYVESSNINGTRIENEESIENRTAYLNLRIPEKKLEEFMSSVGTLGNITNKSITGEDITEQYFDNEAHLKALKIQEDRLLELLKKSGELKDILEIEKELTRVRYDIESLTGNLKKWDSLIQYSTLNIEIQEVQKYKKVNPVSLKDRIYRGFKNSTENVISMIKGLIITIVSLIPYLTIIAPIVFIIKYILRKKAIRFNNPFKKNKDDK